MASCDRSLAPQPVGGCLPFPHGDLPVGSSISPSGGLDGISGPPRCLSSGSGSSIFSPVPEVLCGGFGSSVPRTLFRSFDNSADVYQHHGPGLLDHASVRFQDPQIPGRLARPRILVPGDCAGEGLNPFVMSGAGDSRQSSEKLLDSISINRLSGDETSDVSFEGFPDPQTCPEALLSRSRLRLLSPSSSGVVAPAVGCDVVNVISSAGLSSLHVKQFFI